MYQAANLLGNERVFTKGPAGVSAMTHHLPRHQPFISFHPRLILQQPLHRARKLKPRRQGGLQLGKVHKHIRQPFVVVCADGHAGSVEEVGIQKPLVARRVALVHGEVCGREAGEGRCPRGEVVRVATARRRVCAS